MTDTLTIPLEPATIAGKTRAELLNLCRAVGLKATAWKRDRMAAVLTGEEQLPTPAAKADVKLTKPAPRPLAEEGDAARKRALENRLKRTGKCLSTVCELACSAYEEGRLDAFHWQLCTCGHTQWAHAVPEQA